MKDSTTPKLLLAFAAFAAIGLAVWSGMATSVEAPGAAAAPHGAYTTPF